MPIYTLVMGDQKVTINHDKDEALKVARLWVENKRRNLLRVGPVAPPAQLIDENMEVVHEWEETKSLSRGII
jgi:hypothetical protein